ncbi:MAG: hypothetical protein LBI49_26065 [Nocardiopsaceae bacterium]|nr:hypothetical protein [Nocardiopsaceae bacterium]
MTHPDSVQRQHAPAVLANRLTGQDRWGRRCQGYNLCARPGAGPAADLAAVQDQLLRLEPSLHRVPAPALHVNVAWLLPVHLEFEHPKDELWQQHGAEWTAAARRIVAGTGAFRLCFDRLVATDAAIIAVAREPNPVTALRRELAGALRLGRPLSAGGLVHSTLLRYGGRLRDPAGLLRCLAAAGSEVRQPVSELLVVRERVFPSLDYEICDRLPLAAA